MLGLSVVLRIGDEARTLSFRPGTSVILGRQSDVDVVVASNKASRRHCEIKLTEKGLQLQDLKSANGTLLNGLKVDTSALAAGDVIRIGELAIKVERVDQMAPTASSAGDEP